MPDPVDASAALLLPASISRAFLLHHRICPLRRSRDGAVIVACDERAIESALDDVAAVLGAAVVVERVSATALDGAIERLTAHRARSADGVPSASRTESGPGDSATADVRDLASQPPVVRYVNLLISDAHAAGASDIHLESERRGLAVRWRIDGVLQPAPPPTPELAHAVVSRIKLLADLDIAERRRPQDGRMRIRLESDELELRVATVPTMHGESVALRLLDRGGGPVALEALGMAPALRDRLRAIADRPRGLLLVTGPTGSGKTTTLYACLARRPALREKIVTVEDPIEYELGGVTQIPVLASAGVTFATALRALLRQDPDVVMIGEMRDHETAAIAVQSALTGHLVFATLHTNDAVSAIPRMLDLGVPSYLLAATITAVLAQRLVRRTCDECRERYDPNERLLDALRGTRAAPPVFVRGRGCPRCRGTGFRGRIGLFELVAVDAALADAIANGAPAAVLAAIAARGGAHSLGDDAWAKVGEGLTTVEEVARVVSVGTEMRDDAGG